MLLRKLLYLEGFAMKRLILTVLLILVAMTAWALDWDWPLTDFTPSSGFGFRDDVTLGGGELSVHLGVDLVPNIFAEKPKADVQVKAIADGEVIIVFPPPGTIGYRKDGSKFVFSGHPIYGGMVAIKHWDSSAKMFVYSLYGHMKETWVREGQAIKKGEAIGLVGSTGQSTGPHLHFTLMYDPMQLLEKLMDKKKWIW